MHLIIIIMHLCHVIKYILSSIHCAFLLEIKYSKVFISLVLKGSMMFKEIKS